MVGKKSRALNEFREEIGDIVIKHLNLNKNLLEDGLHKDSVKELFKSYIKISTPEKD